MIDRIMVPRLFKISGARDYFYLLVAFFIAGGVVLGVWFSSGCKSGTGWNVLLITLDTTRADRLRCYGYPNVETPTINSLAKQGVLFENAYSHVPLTLPAHTSILTGTHPTFHRVRDNGAYMAREALVTLAEALGEHGYSTAAFISAAVLKKIYNLDQGFDFWDEEDIEPQEEDSPLVADRKADKTTDSMLRWLDENRDRKWFVWLHYYDPHQSYSPPEPYKNLYALDPYAGEIAFMDSQIRRVFDRLDEYGLFDRTLIIAIADHGEGLNEHDERTHAMLIYNTTQRIPLLLRVPGLKKPGRRISQIVSQVDVMPSVLDLLGFEIPPDVQGRSLKPLVYELEGEFENRPAYMESKFLLYHYGYAEQIGMVTPRYKYIRTPKAEIYDLDDDPNELFNIADESPKLLKELEFRLKGLEDEYAYSGLEDLPSAEIELDEKTRRELRALGYIDGQVQVNEEKANLKDHKDHKQLFNMAMGLNRLFMRGDFHGLLALSDRLLEEDPEFISAVKMKAEALFGLGRDEDALEWNKHMIELFGENNEAYSGMGMICIRMGRLDEAREHFEKALELKRTDISSSYYLGRIYLSQGDMDKAYEIFQEEKIRDTALGHLGMAKYYENMGRTGRAEAEFDMALEINERFSATYIEYAALLYNKGEYRKARELLERALEEDPSVRYDPKFKDYYERTEDYAGAADEEESLEDIFDLKAE